MPTGSPSDNRDPMLGPLPGTLDRRRFLSRGAGIVLAAGSLPALLAACGDDDKSAVQSPGPASRRAGRAIVGDVVDFKLRSDEWEGAFGFVTLRLHEASFDAKPVYFIQTDTSDAAFARERKLVHAPKLAPMATMTHTVFSPALHARPRQAEATGRTNVFMNGIPGPGPMKHQPSVFDSDAGQPQWSPYWDHYAMEWRRGRRPRVLRVQSDVLAARDAGDLIEHPGVPDTKGEVFTVNCPVPVLARATFTG